MVKAKFFQENRDISKVLKEINALNCEVWRMWRYIKQNNMLVLCGYNLPFDTKAFLIFRGVSHICLNQALESAKFEYQLVSNESDCENSKHIISIIFSESISLRQYVICEEITFIIIPSDSYV